MCSHDKEERRFAVERMVGIRQGREKGDINPDAKTLPELCTWDSNVFEPALTCQLSLTGIESLWRGNS